MTRKHVMKAIGVTVMASLIVDTLFAIFVTTTCQEVKERINYDSPQVEKLSRQVSELLGDTIEIK
jgi:hypothetical protein